MSGHQFYRVFGGILESDLEIADLHPIEAVPDPTWVLTTADGEPEAFDGERLGTEPVTSLANVTLLRQGDRYRLEFEDTGSFDFLDGGRRMVWYPKPDSDREAAAVDVLGRCLAIAFHAGGSLCLHGSAVAFDKGTIAFLAPKHHGKSTTALALARSGARLVSDDALPVTLTDPPMAYPGVHAVRLWADSAEQVASDRKSRVGLGGKLVVDDLEGAQVMHDPSPLVAVYLIAPMKADEDPPLRLGSKPARSRPRWPWWGRRRSEDCLREVKPPLSWSEPPAWPITYRSTASNWFAIGTDSRRWSRRSEGGTRT